VDLHQVISLVNNDVDNIARPFLSQGYFTSSESEERKSASVAARMQFLSDVRVF
jgi:hypothetical protein